MSSEAEFWLTFVRDLQLLECPPWPLSEGSHTVFSSASPDLGLAFCSNILLANKKGFAML